MGGWRGESRENKGERARTEELSVQIQGRHGNCHHTLSHDLTS